MRDDDAALAAWDARGAEVIIVRCQSCDSRLGAVHASPAGLVAMLEDPIRRSLTDDERNSLPTHRKAIGRRRLVTFAMVAQAPTTIVNCSCGAAERPVDWQAVQASVKAHKRKVCV